MSEFSRILRQMEDKEANEVKKKNEITGVTTRRHNKVI